MFIGLIHISFVQCSNMSPIHNSVVLLNYRRSLCSVDISLWSEYLSHIYIPTAFKPMVLCYLLNSGRPNVSQSL